MPDLTEQISRLEAGIAAQEALRPTLGDAVVDATLAALQAQLSALRDLHQTRRNQTSGLRPASFLHPQISCRQDPDHAQFHRG